MKTNFKRIGKQSISIVLAVMMMLSTMLVGMVTSNAVEIPANTDFYLDISGATADFTDSNSIYLSVTSDSNKDYTATSSDTTNAANYVPKNDSNWYQMKRIDNTNIYKATVQVSSTVGKVSFWNKDESLYDNVWLVSCTLGATYDGTNNLFTLTESTSHNDRKSNIYSGTWSTYGSTGPNTTHKVTVNFSNATVKLGDNTLTSGTAVTVDNDKDYTLTVTPNSGYSLSKVMQGSTDLGTSGTYTLAAGTDDVTIDITTENSTENDYEFYVTGYMNGNDLTTSNNYKFTKESNGIYTCTMTPTDHLYVTITDKNTGKVYWSASYEELSENTYSTKTVVESGGDKWGILGQANNEIKITFDITARISNGKIKWEYAVADPVSVELNADLVDGSAAYISSYTDNDTGNIVTNTDETVQSVNAKPGTSVTFKAKSVDGYFPKWKFEGKFSTGDTYTLDASSVTGTTVTVYLTYEKIENHNIIVASNKGGNVSYTYNGTAGTVAEGTTSSAISVASNSTITLKANAVKDYVFSGWEFDNESNVVFATGQDSFSTSITINVVGDVKVTATFEEHSGTLSE